MPELPEVEILRRSLIPHLEGRVIKSVDARRPDLRFPLPKQLAQCLSGARVTRLSRKGKYLLVHTHRDDILLLHLGMSGTLRRMPAGSNAEPPPHSHVFFALDDGSSLVYADPRRFGFMDLFAAKDIAANAYLAKLGRDPLCDTLDSNYLQARLRGSKRPIKNALMDQSLIAGLGNIYCCEALFRAGISPHRKAGEVVGKRATPSIRLNRLLDAIQATLQDALEAGGSSIRDYLDAEGEAGYFQHAFQVYDRAGKACPGAGCSGSIRRSSQANRSSFHCPKCQR